MYLVKEGFPEDDELVLCTVTAIHYHSVFVKLDEYNKSGMIHISEISPGRIRNIRDFVVEGKKILCKILKIDPVKGHIDLSLRRVNESQKRIKNSEIKQEQLAENILKFLAQKLKLKPEVLFKTVYTAFIPKYFTTLYEGFEEIIIGNFNPESVLDKSLAKELTSLLLQRIKPPKVSIKGTASLFTYAPEGVKLIKDLFKKGSSAKGNISIAYVGAGAYRIEVTAPDYKEAEAVLGKWLKIVNAYADKNQINFNFVRLE